MGTKGRELRTALRGCARTPTATAAAVILFTLCAAMGPPLLAAQEADPVASVALEYLETLYRSDFERLGDLLEPDAVFDDHTAVAIAGAPLHYEGREMILERFRSGSASARNGGFEIRHSFTTGEYAVLDLIYHTEIDGAAVGKPGAWIPVRVLGVTILRVRDGRVSEHTDHVDYDEMLRQIGDFSAGGDTRSQLPTAVED